MILSKSMLKTPFVRAEANAISAVRKGGVAGRAAMAYINGMKRPILIHPDPRLKKVCAEVPDLTDAMRTLADDMLETMYAAPGVGLAAPQIGVLDRLIVLDCAKEDEESPRPLVMFNPKIVSASDETNVYEEGCLSIPDQYAEVTRPKIVEVEWMNRDGNAERETFDGLWATCVQHEIDHLDGKLFIDYLKPLKRQMITRKMQKLKRERARG
jgi:peptide deformylase